VHVSASAFKLALKAKAVSRLRRFVYVSAPAL
jgi:hypothetical protein